MPPDPPTLLCAYTQSLPPLKLYFSQYAPPMLILLNATLRLIILYAGGENEWVNSADLVFQSMKATGDYHDEMTATYFEEWFHDSLLPNLQSNSIIVMDNVPYHSRKLEPVPTMSSMKQQMQDWLTAKGIVFSECSLKRELLNLIVVSSPMPKYAVVEMAKTAGHEIVRLPPYHCELNL